MSIERAAATANDTLDATSDTLVVGMTITPASGDYLAFSTCTFLTDSASGNHVNTFSIYVGGTVVDHSERDYQEDTSVDNCQLPMVLSCKVSPNGSQAVEVRHRTTNALTPLICQKRELNLFSIPAAGTDYEQSATDTITRTVATFTPIPGIAVTPVADDYLLVFSTSVAATNGESVDIKVTVGGTDVSHTLRTFFAEQSWADSDFPMFIACKVSPNGSESVTVEWARVTGTGTATMHERTMNLVPFDAGDIFEATGTADDADSTTTDKQIDDMLITDPGADDYLVLFSAFDFYGVIDNNNAETQYSIRNGSSRVTDSERVHEHEGSIDSTDIPVMAGGKVTVASGTDDLAMWWQNVTATDTRTIKERTLVAVREAAAGPTDDVEFAATSPQFIPVPTPPINVVPY